MQGSANYADVDGVIQATRNAMTMKAPQHLYPYGNPAMPYAEVPDLDAWIKAHRQQLWPPEWDEDDPEDGIGCYYLPEDVG